MISAKTRIGSSEDAAGCEVRSDTGSTVVPLNLVYSYPVRWSRFKVLRDLVQNFYDAVGSNAWSRSFNCVRSKDALDIEVHDIGFSYEWLLHIGASTKTDAPRGTFAGFFGEGFKIAALCAHRDHGWRISMASRDWELDVVSTDLTIDGAKLRSLGYRVRQRPAANTTWLRLKRFQSADDQVLEAVLLSFYYPDNPLFGECIWKDSCTAIHHRSGHPKPLGFPETSSSGGPGIVFAGLQAMGSFEIPLVVALHDAGPRNRERDTFFRMDVVDTIHTAVSRLPATAAAVVLEMMSRKWYVFPTRRYDFDSVHPVVHTLVQRVASNAVVREHWREAHPQLLVARRVRRSDLPAANRRRQALAWLRRTTPRPRLVQEGFAFLGYPDLETACEQEHGFVCLRHPDPTEQGYLDVLADTVVAICPHMLPEEGLPPLRIIDNPAAAWQGMSDNVRTIGDAGRAGGHRIRYRQTYLALDKKLLVPGRFAGALATYLHELAHVYGGERSAAFSSALTDLIADTAEAAGDVLLARKRWLKLGADQGIPRHRRDHA